MRYLAVVLGVLIASVLIVAVVQARPRALTALVGSVFRPAQAPVFVAPTSVPGPASGFTLSSPAVVDGGDLPRAYTCDGSSSTLPLAWREAPPGTQSLVVIMHHVDGQGETHWYWILYGIPPAVESLPTNVSGIGTLGTNSMNRRTEYAPPCSKGPGPKVYTYTVYALGAPPVLTGPPASVTRDVMLAAIQERILASAALHVVNTR